MRVVMADPHQKQWERLYGEWIMQDTDESRFKARCVRGLLDGTTYDYNEETFNAKMR